MGCLTEGDRVNELFVSGRGNAHGRRLIGDAIIGAVEVLSEETAIEQEASLAHTQSTARQGDPIMSELSTYL